MKSVFFVIIEMSAANRTGVLVYHFNIVPDCAPLRGEERGLRYFWIVYRRVGKRLYLAFIIHLLKTGQILAT